MGYNALLTSKPQCGKEKINKQTGTKLRQARQEFEGGTTIKNTLHNAFAKCSEKTGIHQNIATTLSFRRASFLRTRPVLIPLTLQNIVVAAFYVASLITEASDPVLHVHVRIASRCCLYADTLSNEVL